MSSATSDPAATPDPVETIAAALAQLRGRRGPRPPWNEDSAAGPWSHAAHGHGSHGHGSQGHGPFGAGRHGLGPPWMGGDRGRFAGPARLRVLEALVAASAPLTVSELADAVGVDQPRASRLVQQGVEMGLVRREADPDDARRTRVALTERGETVVRGFRGERRDLVQTALDSFSDDEKRELARLLGKLAAGWPND